MDNSTDFKLGDYVQVKQKQELLDTGLYNEVEGQDYLNHRYGPTISEYWYGRQGYITDFVIDQDIGLEFIRLDSGPVIPSSAIVMSRPALKKDPCECGKNKHGFDGHSSWCPEYKSMWDEFPNYNNTGWSK